MKVIIRKAHKEEAPQIAELFMLAWPVDEILESNSVSYDQLHESIALIAGCEDTIYSYENTIVAEIDGKEMPNSFTTMQCNGRKCLKTSIVVEERGNSLATLLAV